MSETEILQALNIIDILLDDFNLYLDIVEEEAEIPLAA